MYAWSKQEHIVISIARQLGDRPGPQLCEQLPDQVAGPRDQPALDPRARPGTELLADLDKWEKVVKLSGAK